MNFLAHMFTSGYSISTVAAHASALAYIHKGLGFKDFSDSFLVKQFLKGANNTKSAAPDTRLPITWDMLQQIVAAIPTTVKLYMQQVIFTAMCLLAFHAFLRIGEMCSKSSTTENNVIQRQDVHFIVDETGVSGIELTFRRFKHSSHPVTLFLAQSTTKGMCPVHALQNYLNSSSHRNGPLFQLPNGQAVSYDFFNGHLKNVIGFLGLDTNLYKSHSFRIGAATHATMQGHSADQIKKMGRWKSNALERYVRLPRISLP
ncbi:MAG: hypothetical protein ABW185_00580 [Sedimenticola sp.]